MRIAFTLNGQAYVREVEGHRTLLHFIREDLGFTGAKEGCGAGECGACTILLDGEAVNACMVLAAEADGCVLETIEGEAKNGRLSAIQEAFNRHHAVQCGFCTPGMILSVRDLLARNPKPSEGEIREGIEGNFCRCTGYQQIIEAVLDVSGQPAGKGGLIRA
jgi:carbon-monoxide dehydrogenase small subunit